MLLVQFVDRLGDRWHRAVGSYREAEGKTLAPGPELQEQRGPTTVDLERTGWEAWEVCQDRGEVLGGLEDGTLYTMNAMLLPQSKSTVFSENRLQ